MYSAIGYGHGHRERTTERWWLRYRFGVQQRSGVQPLLQARWYTGCRWGLDGSWGDPGNRHFHPGNGWRDPC